MNTHYAHVLATAGGSGVPGDAQRPVSLDITMPEGSGWTDITAVASEDYLIAPSVMLVRVESDEITLDAIASAPGNVELFREAL